MQRRVLPLLMILSVLSLAMTAQLFEGTRWKIKVTPDDEARKAGEKAFDDTITFKGSKFTSDALAKQGFTPTPYDEDTRGNVGPATFKADATSPTAGTAKWSGTIAVQQMTGQLVWTKKDGSTVTFTISGEKL